MMRLERPGAGEIVELAGAGEDHDSNLRVAQDRQLLCLLEQPVPPLREGHLPARRIVDPPYHNLPPPHQLLNPSLFFFFFFLFSREQENEQKINIKNQSNKREIVARKQEE